jgi:putative ABC transport system substrate-binding protein
MRRRAFIALLGGGAATWSLAAHAQPRHKVIGLLNSASQTDWAPRIDAFRDGLKDLGFVEGQTSS